ncbi:hypothetical protein KEM60_00438 [Austwickia sp. TVS 96-490-7B]|nr:hypothetical protein [Austwickia sp. TVS 96-490-7B]
MPYAVWIVDADSQSGNGGGCVFFDSFPSMWVMPPAAVTVKQLAAYLRLSCGSSLNE